MKVGHHDLTMRCPFYSYDDATGEEVECEKDITVRWYPGERQTYDYPGSPPWWECWGCEHAERYPLPLEYETRIEEESRRQFDELEAAYQDRRCP